MPDLRSPSYGQRDQVVWNSVQRAPDGRSFTQGDTSTYTHTDLSAANGEEEPQFYAHLLSSVSRIPGPKTPRLRGNRRLNGMVDVVPYVTLCVTRYPAKGYSEHDVMSPTGQLATLKRLHRWSAGRGW